MDIRYRMYKNNRKYRNRISEYRKLDRKELIRKKEYKEMEKEIILLTKTEYDKDISNKYLVPVISAINLFMVILNFGVAIYGENATHIVVCLVIIAIGILILNMNIRKIRGKEEERYRIVQQEKEKLEELIIEIQAINEVLINKDTY